MSDSAKRTRSQVTLPDDILHLPERSPLKDARIALRNNTTEISGSHLPDSSESDDELLLSPGKDIQQPKDSKQRTSLASKRSASPPLRDEYTSRPDSPSDGRVLKRVKRDPDVDQDVPGCAENITILESRFPSAHSRSASQPNMGNSSNPPPASVQRPASALRTSPGKDRARSVPIFSSSFSFPHIDLRNPPPSPRRARSQSPLKEREAILRITSGPTQVAQLETIEDDIGPEVHADNSLSTSSAAAPQSLPNSANDVVAKQGISLGRPEATNDDSERPSIPTVHELPSTPTAIQTNLTLSLSPLTPLPPTPLPSSSYAPSSKHRYTTAGWATDGDEEDKDDLIVIMSQESRPLLDFGTTRKSRLPRPSNISSVTSPCGPSPTPNPMPKSTPLMGPPLALPAGKQSLSFGTSKRLSATEGQTSLKPTMRNAFTVLMGQARKEKGPEQPKGKAREKASSVKGGPSSSSIASSSNATIPLKQKGRGQDKREVTRPKISIKAKMRPKERIKPKREPISPVMTDEDDGHSPPPKALSPMNVPKSSNPPPTVPEDLPTEASAPDSDINMPLSGTHSPSYVSKLAHPATHPLTDVDVPMEDSPKISPLEAPSQSQLDTPHDSDLPEASTLPSFPMQSQTSPMPNEAASAEADFPGRRSEGTSVNPQLASKLPLVKKVRSTIATDRVTRRMSQRQREKQVKSSSQASTAHRTTVQKQNLFSVASDPKTVTTSVDPQASTSSLPTDPISEKPVPPGSPMNLSSPVRKIVTAPEGTGARLTRSSTEKTPSKPKFSPKSASPTKLVRSVSMSSTHPPGGLTRTLTEFGNNQGSSLSTLANALEKLRMPPPERPNTSMGFNRELDVDCDLGSTKYSTDDSSIGGPVPESTTLKRTVSVDSVESDAGSSGEVHSLARPGPLHSEQASSRLFSRKRVGAGRLYSGSGLVMRGGKITSSLQHKPRIPGVATFGSGRASKVSRKTSLPSVMASPVKGNGAVDAVEDADMDSSDLDVILRNHTDASSVISFATSEPTAKNSPSRRVSLASQALSQSLSSLPSKRTQLMGPPTTPPNRRPGLRSSSSSYPSSMPSASRQVSLDTPASGNTPASLGKVKIGGGDPSSGKSVEHPTASSNLVLESLKILGDCVIFVDVRTDDGDEAGSLFVEMLEGVGAKILTRVGQTCTHIVYKNGLMSTLTRYRLLRDPKPLVVGIAWVVECVEQRKRVEESKFIVNLDGVNVAGTNKRRRSMLPKWIRREPGGVDSSDIEGDQQGIECDQSMDGSSSSMTMDEDLTPLELARRRRTGLGTP